MRGGAERVPPAGVYRSGPVRPRWQGPGWGTVALAGFVVAAMGWTLFAERTRAEEPAGVASGERDAVVAGGWERPRGQGRSEEVKVSWERKTGVEAVPATAPPDGAGARAAGLTERVRKRAEPQKRVRAKPDERVRTKARRPVRRVGEKAAPPVRAKRDAPESGVLPRLAGEECERWTGMGRLCASVLERMLAGQAQGGR